MLRGIVRNLLKLPRTAMLLAAVAGTFPALCLHAREWKTKRGQTFEGEIYKCSKLLLTIVDAEKKRTQIALDDLSDADKKYLRDLYPEFFPSGRRDKKNRDSDDAPQDPSESWENPDKIEWPVIVVKPESVAFRWDTKRGRFYTRHYRFDMKKPLSQDEAKALALRCESAYESVRRLPFWPKDRMRRDARDGAPNADGAKFNIEITKIAQSKVAGRYIYSFTGGGALISEKVEVEPQYMPMSNPQGLSFSGTLAHELCHQIFALYGGTTAIKEGVSEYVWLSVYSDKGITYFNNFEHILKNSRVGHQKEVVSPPLKKLFTMPQKKFCANNAHNNYLCAQLVVVYFALNKPDVFKKFLEKALNTEPRVLSEKKCAELCAKAFPILLEGGKETDLEKRICDYYQTLGIKMRFR